MELLFEWDSNKARKNLRKHKVSFEEAKTVFNDPFTVTYLAPEHSDDEERQITLGVSVIARLLLVVHTDREEETIRIISCRKATLAGDFMNEEKTKQFDHEEENMLPEYDFTGMKGVRGKYYQAYRQGHTVKIQQDDGTITQQYFTLEDGAVLLEPDVREYFPDSEAVNRALRGLITLVPAKRKTVKRRKAQI